MALAAVSASGCTPSPASNVGVGAVTRRHKWH